MNTQYHKTWFRPGICAIGLAIFVALSPRGGATDLTVNPPVQNVAVGTSFDLTLLISGLGNHVAPSLGTFDLDLNFDPTLFKYDSAIFGDPSLGDLLGPVNGSVTGSQLSGAGDSLNLFSVSLDSSSDLALVQPGQFTLASLRFTALTLGSGTFSLANIVLGDANGDPLVVNAIGSAAVNVNSQVIPETLPSWAALLAFGGLAVGHNRLNRRPFVS